jgi:hypothetical protein
VRSNPWNAEYPSRLGWVGEPVGVVGVGHEVAALHLRQVRVTHHARAVGGGVVDPVVVGLAPVEERDPVLVEQGGDQVVLHPHPEAGLRRR